MHSGVTGEIVVPSASTSVPPPTLRWTRQQDCISPLPGHVRVMRQRHPAATAAVALLALLHHHHHHLLHCCSSRSTRCPRFRHTLCSVFHRISKQFTHHPRYTSPLTIANGEEDDGIARVDLPNPLGPPVGEPKPPAPGKPLGVPGGRQLKRSKRTWNVLHFT